MQTEIRYPHSAAGLALGACAILLWSCSSACIVFTGKRIGVWQFLAITSLAAGLLQLIGYRGMGKSLRSVLLPPLKLWIAVAMGFVLYLLLYTAGLVMSRNAMQAMGVSLVNYLWPTLTILLTTWLVPGERMQGRLAVAMALALAGVLLANGCQTAGREVAVNPWPYALAGAAAVSWAVYCALISRWRGWATNYPASPLGFLLVGAIAAAVCGGLREWRPMTGRTWAAVGLAAVGPWAGGYMLWEMALHRASGITLGLMAAATPVLSTLTLIGLFAVTAPGRVSGRQGVLLLAAAFMISAAVALGRHRPERSGAPAETLTEPMASQPPQGAR